MLTPEEDKFLTYWAEQRLHKKSFLKKFSLFLPVVALAATVFFINFLSGWYGKADNVLRKHSSLIFTILIAIVITAVFVSIFSAKHKFDRNEADYQALLQKKSAAPSSSEIEPL